MLQTTEALKKVQGKNHFFGNEEHLTNQHFSCSRQSVAYYLKNISIRLRKLRQIVSNIVSYKATKHSRNTETGQGSNPELPDERLKRFLPCTVVRYCTQIGMKPCIKELSPVTKFFEIGKVYLFVWTWVKPFSKQSRDLTTLQKKAFETLWENEKMLVTSIFSFSLNVFYSCIEEMSSIQTVVCSSLPFLSVYFYFHLVKRSRQAGGPIYRNHSLLFCSN